MRYFLGVFMSSWCNSIGRFLPLLLKPGLRPLNNRITDWKNKWTEAFESIRGNGAEMKRLVLDNPRIAIVDLAQNRSKYLRPRRNSLFSTNWHDLWRDVFNTGWRIFQSWSAQYYRARIRFSFQDIYDLSTDQPRILVGNLEPDKLRKLPTKAIPQIQQKKPARFSEMLHISICNGNMHMIALATRRSVFGIHYARLITAPGLSNTSVSELGWSYFGKLFSCTNFVSCRS
jgi:hypothetical protein